MIDLHAIDEPEGLLICIVIFPDVALACWIVLSVITAGLLPEEVLACIVTTESSVKDNIVILEMCGDVAGGSAGDESWGDPKRWVGVSSNDISWDFTPREVPNLNGRFRPFHYINTTSNVVEWGSIGRAIGGNVIINRASLVEVLRGRVLVVVVADTISISVTALVRFYERASGGGMQCLQIDSVLADIFEDINLAFRRVVIAKSDRPEGWPGTTDRSGHVVDISNKETSVI